MFSSHVTSFIKNEANVESYILIGIHKNGNISAAIQIDPKGKFTELITTQLCVTKAFMDMEPSLTPRMIVGEKDGKVTGLRSEDDIQNGSGS